MTTIAQTSEFNVTATLNYHFYAALAAFTLPSWLPLPTVYADFPESEPTLPAFSLTHFGVDSARRWQGDSDGTNKATLDTALMEISAWASRSNVNWSAQIRTMTDLIKSWAVANANLRVKDYAASLSAPSDTAYLVRLRDAREVDVMTDPNPDVRRRRVLIAYRWVYRA